jgi:pimeloyl-ACP methyl ester carboxylesterase
MIRRNSLVLVVTAFFLSPLLTAGEKPSHEFMVASDGVKIHYMTQGQGTPVVLIHGYTGRAEGNWFSNGVAEALAKKHRVIAIDCRGHGQSDKPYDPAKYGDRMWKDVVELMDHLKIDRTHVHGYSMGGMITAQLLAHCPQRFITASFGGSGVRETDPKWVAKVPKDKEGVDPQEAEARKKLAGNPARDPKALDAVRQSFLTRKPNPIDLTKIEIPVLAINGEFDSPNAKTVRMQRELKNFKSVILPGKSHLTAATFQICTFRRSWISSTPMIPSDASEWNRREPSQPGSKHRFRYLGFLVLRYLFRYSLSNPSSQSSVCSMSVSVVRGLMQHRRRTVRPFSTVLDSKAKPSASIASCSE